MFGKDPSNTVEYEALELKDRIHIPITATVPQNLNYLATVVAKYYDVNLQKETTNQTAKADLIIDGVVIGNDIPAVYLLGMETKLKAWRTVLEAIPTMAPGVDWVPAPETGMYVYRSKDVSHDVKTAKTVEHKVQVQPNPNIPCTFVAIDINKNIGEYTESLSTGMIFSADKAKLIERLDNLLKAVKQARMRANDVELVKCSIGDNIMSYLFGAWYDPAKANTEATI